MHQVLFGVIFMIFMKGGRGQLLVSVDENVVYTFSHFGAAQKNASRLCMEIYNGQLVTILNENVQNHLNEQLNKITSLGTSSFSWISLKHDMAWQWPDNIDPLFNNWDKNTGNGSCAAISQTTGKWTTMQCDANLPYICEAKLTSQMMDNIDFIFSDVKVRYNDADAICMSQNMTSVSITSAMKQREIDDYLAQYVNSTMEYYIANPSTIPHTYSNWAPGYPHTIADETCTYVSTSVNITGKWKNGKCYKAKRFICEKSTDIPVTIETVQSTDSNLNEMTKTEKMKAQTMKPEYQQDVTTIVQHNEQSTTDGATEVKRSSICIGATVLMSITLNMLL